MIKYYNIKLIKFTLHLLKIIINHCCLKIKNKYAFKIPLTTV